MKGKQTALFPGNEDKVGYWITPWDEEPFVSLKKEFDFDCDPVPYPRPEGYNGIVEEWGVRSYVNPPFDGPHTKFSSWAKKCVLEYQKGKTVVLIYPMYSWLRILVEAGVEIRSIGHVNWRNPKGQSRRSPMPCFLFILRPKEKVNE